MVKRKTGFDAAEKAAKKQKTNRKVSKKIDLDEMCHIHKDGELLIKKGDEVYFERLKESKPILCVGSVISITDHKPSKGKSINIWDETHEECYGFTFPKDIELVKVRMFETIASLMAPETPKPEVVVAVVQPNLESLEVTSEESDNFGMSMLLATVESMPGIVTDASVDDEGTALIIDCDTDEAP